MVREGKVNAEIDQVPLVAKWHDTKSRVCDI